MTGCVDDRLAAHRPRYRGPPAARRALRGSCGRRSAWATRGHPRAASAPILVPAIDRDDGERVAHGPVNQGRGHGGRLQDLLVGLLRRVGKGAGHRGDPGRSRAIRARAIGPERGMGMRSRASAFASARADPPRTYRAEPPRRAAARARRPTPGPYRGRARFEPPRSSRTRRRPSRP